jgi:hypothetical protein
VSQRLVIDTSVTSAAGSEASEDPTASSCRDFLKAVLKICHKFVLTPEMHVEWREHRSSFASTWLTSMDARKKVIRIAAADVERLGTRIAQFSDGEEREAMIKDLPLLLAANATDSRVVSLDEKVRALLTAVSVHIGQIRNIVWVNPSKPNEGVPTWLEDDAPVQDQRKLGYIPR